MCACVDHEMFCKKIIVKKLYLICKRKNTLHVHEHMSVYFVIVNLSRSVLSAAEKYDHVIAVALCRSNKPYPYSLSAILAHG
eukprot:m.80016 g.80016  ORF g.80016 m.80016 type:complete len:82 (+) comp12001_c1_seq3:470-715(+)